MSIRVLFVCHGNICRSTMAQSVFSHMVKEKSPRALLRADYIIESAATSREEIGNPPHHGTVNMLRRNEIPLIPHRATQMTKADYDKYDYLIGMDEANIRNMKRIAGGDPQGKIHKLLSFAGREEDVADPWYTGDFEKTYEDIIAGCEGLLRHIETYQAVRYLEKDYLLNVSMIEVLRRKQAHVVSRADDGVLVLLDSEPIYMLSADTTKTASELLADIDDLKMIVVHGEKLFEYVREKYSKLSESMPCFQAAYTKDEAPSLKKSSDFRVLDKSFFRTIREHYKKIDDDEYVDMLLENKAMYGIFVGGSLAGFIGMHEEGSIGLLEVFPEYRNKGMGTELERFMIIQNMKQSYVPFAQIEVDNHISIDMQRKLGMDISKEMLMWLL